MTEEAAKYRPYDETDPQDIERFAKRLIGKTLREVLPDGAVDPANAGKGNFGNLLETGYFLLDVGSSPQPDFAKAGVELKATPLKRVKDRRSKKEKLRAKERLVLQMINYAAVREEEWERSSFLRKNSHLLLVFYEWRRGASLLDYEFKIVQLWKIPAEDLPVIRQDWETIVGKIKSGRAHEISERDTEYLAACVKGAKGSDRVRIEGAPDAKPRAWSLKAGYMNTVIDRSLRKKLQSVVAPAELEAGLTLEQAIVRRFEPYIGLTADEIARELGVTMSDSAKHRFALLAKKLVKGMLGVMGNKHVAEFEKAEIELKTIRLKPNGMPKEAMSFPRFEYKDLVTQDWETSDLRDVLSRRFLFVIFQLDHEERPTLRAVRFWSMPDADIEGAKECFDETVRRIMAGQAEHLPTSTQNRVCHVRPKGRNKQDVEETPTGQFVTKKCFWLNQRYLKQVIADLL